MLDGPSCAFRARAPQVGNQSGRQKLRVQYATVPLSDHELTVLMINETNEESEVLTGAHVRAGHHAATTDGAGRAVLALPKGTYIIEASKQRYRTVTATVEVNADIEISFATKVIADKDPQYVREHWLQPMSAVLTDSWCHPMLIISPGTTNSSSVSRRAGL